MKTKKNLNCIANRKSTTSNFEDCKHGLCDKQRPAKKLWLNYSNQLGRAIYDNITKIRRTIENLTGLQSNPAGNVINLSNKNFIKTYNENF